MGLETIGGIILIFLMLLVNRVLMEYKFGLYLIMGIMKLKHMELEEEVFLMCPQDQLEEG